MTKRTSSDEAKTLSSAPRDAAMPTARIADFLNVVTESPEQLLEIQRDLALSLCAADRLVDGLQKGLMAVLAATSMDCGGIYLFEEETGGLRLMAHHNVSAPFARAVAFYDAASPYVDWVRKAEPMCAIHHEIDLPHPPEAVQEGIRAFSLYPLFDGNERIGCMNLGSHESAEVPAGERFVIEYIAVLIGVAAARLKARESLRESEEHLRSLMESAVDFAVYRLAADERTPHHLRLVFASPSIQDILGIQHPMAFETWFAHIHPDDVARVTEANRRAFETNRFDEEYRTFHPARGEWRWIHAISTGGRTDEGWNRYVNGIMLDVTDKKKAQEALEASQAELKKKAAELEEINTTLNVLLTRMKQESLAFRTRMSSNLQQLVWPYLEKLQRSQLNHRQRHLIDILKSNLTEFADPFSQQLSSRHFGLTPMEIQVADLIRQGHKSKDIGEVLGLSYKTVQSHREKIRKKLGISNMKINLRAHLLSME